jgi:hypothetical protein
MAVTVDTLKLTQVQGVVAVREDGDTPATGTIALATTLKKATETQANPEVDISSIYWTLGSGVTGTITRDSQVLYTLSLAGKMEFYGFSENTGNDSDIEVDMDGAGTIILSVNKISGYGPQAHQGADGDLG